MPRDYKQYLDDIIEAIIKIINYTSGMSYDEFITDSKTVDAVVRNLEIIGEASKNVPDTIIHNEPHIEWKKIRAMRNILAHQYFGISNKIIWDVVANKLDPLQKACENLLEIE